MALIELDSWHYQIPNSWQWWNCISGTIRYQISSTDGSAYWSLTNTKYLALTELDIWHYQIPNIWHWWCWISGTIRYQISGTNRAEYLALSGTKYPALMLLDVRHYLIPNIWCWWSPISDKIDYKVENIFCFRYQIHHYCIWVMSISNNIITVGTVIVSLYDYEVKL